MFKTVSHLACPNDLLSLCLAVLLLPLKCGNKYGKKQLRRLHCATAPTRPGACQAGHRARTKLARLRKALGKLCGRGGTSAWRGCGSSAAPSPA